MPDDNRKIVIRFFFIARVVPSEGEESLADHQENLLQKISRARTLGPDSVRHKPKQRYGLYRETQNSRKEITTMTAKALFVTLEAKPGRENEVAKFLRDAQGLVQQEPATTAWFGIKLGPTTFAIFDAFPDDAGRDAHLSGKVAKALMEKAPDLLAQPPKIEKADVLADRLPG